MSRATDLGSGEMKRYVRYNIRGLFSEAGGRHVRTMMDSV